MHCDMDILTAKWGWDWNLGKIDCEMMGFHPPGRCDLIVKSRLGN